MSCTTKRYCDVKKSVALLESGEPLTWELVRVYHAAHEKPFTPATPTTKPKGERYGYGLIEINNPNKT